MIMVVGMLVKCLMMIGCVNKDLSKKSKNLIKE